MKSKAISLAIAVVFLAAPSISLASDKEVQAPTCHKTACIQKNHRQQVALYVCGRGMSDQPTAPRTFSVPSAQTGQGMGVTFFTGNR